MLRSLLIAALLSSPVAMAFDFPEKPDPQMTSGDLCDENDPDFEGYRYKEKIAYCVRNVSFEDKKRIYEAYGVPENCRSQYTIDHFYPLSMGGNNQDANLWPEHKNVKATRQQLEQDLFEEIKEGKITQRKALEIILNEKMNPPAAKPMPCRG